MKVLGARLKQARENADYKQIDAAKKLGISNGTLSGYERNYRDPDTDILNKMAELYEVSTDWLLGKGNLNIEDMTDDEIDEELKEVQKEMNVWYKNEPNDKRLKLRMLRQMIRTFKDEE